jgi:leader peptidase (prepilin peptidase)/N-methyltransferase
MIAAFLIIVFAIGASIGSFLNVCIGRWPEGLSVVRPRSRCPRCGHEIAWFENIPIVSWLALRARCRGCGKPISMQYPIVELVTGLGWVAAAIAFGPTFLALRVAVFGTVLLGVAITDLQRYLIPDGFTVFGLIWGIGTSILAAFFGEVILFAGPWNALLGACVGAGAIAITGWLGEAALKKEAMGFGDVTLMAMIGAALGPGRSLLTIFFGALLGAVTFLAVVYPVTWLRRRSRARRLSTSHRPERQRVVVRGKRRAQGNVIRAPRRKLLAWRSGRQAERAPDAPLVPFGVFLAPAAMIALLWGDALVRWYLQFVQG